MSNCGLAALKQITELRTVSMYSLIHLAKDNGINLYFCKANNDQLMTVKRPAIFHQKNHFVFVSNGDPMPPGEYDGYVLTPKPINEPLSHSLAKRIYGSKKIAGLLAPIVTGVASLVNPVLGAAVGAGFAGYGASKAPGGIGKNWWQVPLGAATGYLQGASGGTTFGIGNAALAGGLAAAGQVPTAIKTGNWMAPVAAGIGQYAGAKFIGGAQGGLSAAQAAGQGFLGQAGGAVKGGIQGVLGGGAQQAAGGTPGGGGIEIARGTVGSTPAGYGGSYTIPGIGNRIVGLPGGTGPAGYSPGALRAAGGGGTSSIPGRAPSNGTFDLSKLLPGGDKKSGLSWLGTAASTLIPPPKLESDIQGSFSKASQYLGNEQFKSLPQATRRQLEDYINTPLDQLALKLTSQDDKSLRMLDQQKQKAIDEISTQYANYGQDPYSSTEAQQKISEITRQYDQAKSELQQQIQNQGMQQAVSFKTDMLQKSMQQGQFDYESAMELATYLGRDQELKYALESQDHQKLQNVLAEIFSSGISR